MTVTFLCMCARRMSEKKRHTSDFLNYTIIQIPKIMEISRPVRNIENIVENLVLLASVDPNSKKLRIILPSLSLSVY